MNTYYVYACYVNEAVKYVGMGKGQRFKHCISGKSSCAMLNKDFFNGEVMRTEIINEGMTRTEALHFESGMISDIGIDRLYNISSGKVDELAVRAYSMMEDLFLEITKHTWIEFNGVRDLFIHFMRQYKDPISDILNHDRIERILALFGYSYDGYRFNKETSESKDDVMQIIKSKMIKA